MILLILTCGLFKRILMKLFQPITRRAHKLPNAAQDGCEPYGHYFNGAGGTSATFALGDAWTAAAMAGVRFWAIATGT